MNFKTNHTVLLIALALFSPSFGPCDESLPVYEEPAKVFVMELNVLYDLEHYGDRLIVYILVRNVFDETLQGTAAIRGTVEIISVRDTTVKKTFQLSSERVIQAKGYDRRTGILTIDPQDTVRLGVSWDFIDDSGRDLRGDFFQYYDDLTCYTLRRLAYTEHFVFTGAIKVFDKTTQVQAKPVEFPLCYVTAFIKTCPSPRPCYAKPTG